MRQGQGHSKCHERCKQGGALDITWVRGCFLWVEWWERPPRAVMFELKPRVWEELVGGLKAGLGWGSRGKVSGLGHWHQMSLEKM